jgi:catechol 2,3-dioxygenase-like lactoylglutathione lyase family enzyme
MLLTQDADVAALRLRAAKVTFVSSGVVANHMEKLEIAKAFLVRDPDGHTIEIAAK